MGLNKIFVYISFTLLLSNCYTGKVNDSNKINGSVNMPVKINQDCDFSKVDLEALGVRNECTPDVPSSEIDNGLRGIFINAPKISKFKIGQVIDRDGTFARIPVCALSVFDSNQLDKTQERELIVVVDTKTHQAFKGQFIEPDMDAPLPLDMDGPPLNELSDVSVLEAVFTQTMSFSFNLAKYVELPIKNASYHLYITKGPFKSNVITIQVVEDDN